MGRALTPLVNRKLLPPSGFPGSQYLSLLSWRSFGGSGSTLPFRLSIDFCLCVSQSECFTCPVELLFSILLYLTD